MEFDSRRPIYIQIADSISEKILAGEFKPGGRIPSVREWAAGIGVNPNTVARSYEILSDRGVILGQRGLGFFVQNDALDVIRDNERKHFVDEEFPQILHRAELLGIQIEDLIKK